MTSIWRQEATFRLRGDDFLAKILGGESQTITAEFWEVSGEPGPITGDILQAQQPQTQTAAGLLAFLGTVGQAQEAQGSIAGGLLEFLGGVSSTQLAQIQEATGTVQEGGAPVYGTVDQQQELQFQTVLGYMGFPSIRVLPSRRKRKRMQRANRRY